MEISGEDDQTNSAGARSAGRDLQKQQEWWTQTPLPDDQTPEQDWWTQTPVPSRQAVEKEWSAQAPTPADLSEAQEWSVQPSPPMQLMNTLVLWRTSGGQCARPFMGLVERGSTTAMVASSTLGQC